MNKRVNILFLKISLFCCFKNTKALGRSFQKFCPVSSCLDTINVTCDQALFFVSLREILPRTNVREYESDAKFRADRRLR